MAFLDLVSVAPHLEPSVAARAQAAYECSSHSGQSTTRLIVVDMSLPSSQQRLWAFDLSDPKRPTLLLKSEAVRVAHGAGSDPEHDGRPARFGNDLDSGKTSLGLYRVAERYSNAEGRTAFALDGLDGGFNDMARARHVVLHPSVMVPQGAGHVGLSLGCPAVSPNTFETLARSGVEGALLWIDGPEPKLARAPSLACAPHVPIPDPPVCKPRRIDLPYGGFSLTGTESARINAKEVWPWAS